MNIKREVMNFFGTKGIYLYMILVISFINLVMVAIKYQSSCG